MQVAFLLHFATYTVICLGSSHFLAFLCINHLLGYLVS